MRPRARGPTAILRMYMSGSSSSDPGGPTAIIDIAPLPPRATMPRPSSGSSARSTDSPPAPMRRAGRELARPRRAPITIVPSIGSSVERRLHRPSSAASSAASWSSRPSQRAPASAARSVARAKSSQRQVRVRARRGSPHAAAHATPLRPSPSSTSSMTAPIAARCSSFSITGTPSRVARSTM